MFVLLSFGRYGSCRRRRSNPSLRTEGPGDEFMHGAEGRRSAQGRAEGRDLLREDRAESARPVRALINNFGLIGRFCGWGR